MKLDKTMLQYVLDKKQIWNNDFNPDLQSSTRYIKSTSDYANFLNQPLNISMFVPAKLVDGEWVVLKEPKGVKCCSGILKDCYCRGDLQFVYEDVQEYQIAKENVIFEGFELVEFDNQSILVFDYCSLRLKNLKEKTIEDLIPFRLTLNPNLKTLKQLFL